MATPPPARCASRVADAAERMLALQDVAREVHAGPAFDPAGRARIAAAYDEVARVARELMSADELAAAEGTPPAGAHPPGECRHLSCNTLCLLQSLCAVREEPWFVARPGGLFDAECARLRHALGRA